MPIVVKKEKGDTKDDILYRFRKIVLEEGIVEEVRNREKFISNSRKKYEKSKEKKRKSRKGGF